jgi:site-specific recombinase XerD
MSPLHKAANIAEQYDMALHYARDDRLPPDAPRPRPTRDWPEGNLAMLERYRDWLVNGGISLMVTNSYHVIMAGHVLGLTLKPHQQLDPENDLECAMKYVEAKQLSPSWNKNCRNSLLKFRRFLRQERGLGEPSTTQPFDVAAHTAGLPAWLVSELERYLRIQQRNWRPARLEYSIRCFWSRNLGLWRFLCEQRGVHNFSDVKRKYIMDYVDQRLGAGRAVSGVNNDLHGFQAFLGFLQLEGYSVPQSLLRVPVLKQPERLPRFLTDEQVRKLRDEVERIVQEAQRASQRRDALLVRAVFYLLWQGGLRLGELEELLLEDLDIPARRLSIRNGKGMKDRTVYLTDTVIAALRDYLAVRGEGSGDYIFLYRNAQLKKDLVRDRLKLAGKRVGVKVYPHRLRHTCATQLLNAGCRVTSIQKFLGHKSLSTTMIYAHAHDQTVAEDYFAAMARVEQRFATLVSSVAETAPVPDSEPETEDEIVNVQEQSQILAWVERLALPELCQEERLEIADSLKQAFSLNIASQHAPPIVLAEFVQ